MPAGPGLTGSGQTQPEEAIFDSLEVDPEAQMPPLPLNLWSPLEKEASASSYYLVGEYLSLEGEGGAAASYLQAAYELAPNAFLAEKHLQGQAQAGGSPEEVLAEAQKFALYYPEDASLQVTLGKLLQMAKRWLEAEEALQKAVNLDPALEAAYAQLVTLYQEMGKDSLAREQARRMAKALPSSVLAWSLLASLYVALPDYPRAFQALSKAYELSPDSPDLLLMQAFLAEKNSKTALALNLYGLFFQDKLAHLAMLERTVLAVRIFGGLEPTLAVLQKLSKQLPAREQAFNLYQVLVLWQLKRNAEAADLLQTMLAANPDGAQLLFLAGLGAEQLQQKSEAKSYFAKVGVHSPYYVPSRYKMSQILREEKNLEAALEVILAVLPQKYVTWDLYTLAAEILGDLNRLEQALTLLDTGYKRYPNKVKLLFMRGVYEQRAQQEKVCMQTMRAVIAKEPTFSAAYNYLGYLLAERGENLQEAESLILQALALRPDDAYYLDSLAWVYYKQGDYERALPLLEKALSSQPTEGLILEHAGDVWLAKGQRAQAATYYRKALEANLETPDDKERIQDKLDASEP